MSGQRGGYTRSASGMVGAMVVLLAFVGIYVAFRAVTRDTPANPVETVAYESTARYAAGEAGFDLVAPPALPDGWKATSAGYTPGPEERWHLGLLTDDERYVGLEQADLTTSTMVESYVDEEAVEGEPVDVAGAEWDTWTDDGGDLALVRRDGDTTTLVVGHEVPRAELVAFTASLQPPA